MIEPDDRGPLDLTRQIEDKDVQIKKLEAEVGNLQVQNADYQQIVQELSDNLAMYESLHGKVFRSSEEKK